MAAIPVNEAQWNAVSKDEQEKIIKGLVESGILESGDTVVPDANAESLDSESGIFLSWDPIKDIKKQICKRACDLAAAAAASWCTANTAGVGLVACLALAKEGHKRCRKKC